MFFFFNDTATTEIYTLSLHDALPIWHEDVCGSAKAGEINGAGQHYCISTFPDRPCPTAHSCYGGDCGRQRVTPIQIDWNLVEGIVAGKSRGIKLKTDILPGHAERIENSPSGRNCGEWIIQPLDIGPTKGASLDLPEHAEV